MRFSSLLRSGMRFGKMDHVRGRVEYTISPYELNPYKDFIKRGVPNNMRWIKREAPWFIIPGLFIYLTMEWAYKANKKFHRKKEGQFDNEVLKIQENAVEHSS